MPKQNRLKIYKLPLLERFAHHYVWLKSLLILLFSAAIIIPIMAANGWNLWFLLFFLPFLVIAVFSLFNLSRWFYYKAQYDIWKANVRESPNHASIFGGAPGTGKSLTAVASVYEMAKASWEELKYEYWLLINRSRKKGYVESEEKRLPYRMNAVVDEIGALTSIDGVRKRQEGNLSVLKVSEHFKFCRQYTELRLIGTEQDTKNIYIDVRRVVAENRIYKSHKVVLKPIFLSWVFKKLKLFFTNKGKITSKFFSKFMKNFATFLRAAGFIQIKYHVSVNTETGQSADTGEKGVIYLPCLQEWRYNTRAYRDAYSPIKNKIDIDVFDMDSLKRDEMLGLLRSYVEEKRKIDEKKKS